jgi:transposase
MCTRSRPQNWKEARRVRAWELKQAGWRPQAIATALGVSKGAVSQWLGAVERQGVNALLARPHTGRPPELTAAQLLQLPDFLGHGAEAYGFRGEVWTCGRIASVIAQEFGVRYHKAHVSRLVKRLNWTPQKPIERATQRDEARIAAWRTETWPALKKRPPASAGRWFSSMNPASTCCRQWCAPTPRVGRRRCCAFFRPVTTCWS